MAMTWIGLHPDVTVEHLGFIPGMLDNEDPAPAREQLDRNYQYGGGWRPFVGHKLENNLTLTYPGDPPTRPLAMTRLRDEMIVLYEHAWVAII